MLDKQIVDVVRELAHKNSIPEAALLAVVDTESAGRAFWQVGGTSKPPIRFEGHYFYDRLEGDKLKQAISEGLASQKVGGVKNPRSYNDRYALLVRAAAIDPQAAYESTSWGLGQVMGANWQSLGYNSVDELVNAAYTIKGQVDMMVRFIKVNGLMDEIKRKDWSGFARVYNGPAYRRNSYHTKMADAYHVYNNAPSSDYKVENSATIIQLQTMLNTVGKYNLTVDGVFGDKTKAALMDFQIKNGLTADGIYGPISREELEKDYREVNTKSEDILGKIGASAGAAGAAATEAAKQIEPIADTSQVLQWVFVGLIVVGAFLTLKATVFK